MPDLKNCPEQALLQQLAHGRLPEGAAQQVEQHLGECDSCIRTLIARPCGDQRIPGRKTFATVYR